MRIAGSPTYPPSPPLVQAVRVLVAGGALRLEISHFCIGLVVGR